jgi:hypothetical protein
MLRQLVRAEECANANQVPSNAYLLLRGCTYDMQIQHSPNYDRPLGFEELRDQSMLQELRNRHNDHHREQRLLDVTEEQSDDMEFEQIY